MENDQNHSSVRPDAQNRGVQFWGASELIRWVGGVGGGRKRDRIKKIEFSK